MTAGGPLLVAADMFDATSLQYRSDPVAFVHDCFDWRRGTHPTDYQDEVLAELHARKRVAVRGPHGIGKTTIDAWAVLHFAMTCDLEGLDWKVPTTASAWRQLTHYLWPEIRKWARLMKYSTLGRKSFTRYELLHQNLKLSTGEAFAAASDEPASIEGAHADRMLYVLDEAKTIPSETWDAVEGAFSGAGDDTPVEALALANSTPGPPVGRFYEIHARLPGYEDWHTIHVTLDSAIRAGRISASWAEQRRKQWGEGSAVYKNRVLGEFAASEADSVVPLEWVERANDRYRELRDANAFERHELRNVGVDVARSGSDSTVIAVRLKPNIIQRLERTRSASTMETAGSLIPYVARAGVYAMVDVIGIGAGVVDRLREQSYECVPYNGSAGTKRTDRSGEMGFVNVRSAAYWNLREMLDPDSGEDVALPPDDLLTGDLTTPTWSITSNGRIQVETKEKLVERLGRSPDSGDAVAMALWTDEPPRTHRIASIADYRRRTPGTHGITNDLMRRKF